MPAISSILYGLIRDKVNSNIKSLSGAAPLDILKDPSYFEEMCKSIAAGIADGTPSVNFTTVDAGFMAAPIIPAIIGQGVGIRINPEYMIEKVYTEIRNTILSDFGNTTHEPYPPSSNNSGKYLEAVISGVAMAINEHFSTIWVLTSAHPTIYSGTGKILDGKFKGLIPSTITGLILNNSPKLAGPLWPKMAKAIAEGYVDTIHNKSTGNVIITGVCVPTPIPPQACGIPSVGTGSGVAT